MKNPRINPELMTKKERCIYFSRMQKNLKNATYSYKNKEAVINITISAPVKRGKSGLAFKLAEFLSKNGFKVNVCDDNGKKVEEDRVSMLWTYDLRFESAKKHTVNIRTVRSNPPAHQHKLFK